MSLGFVLMFCALISMIIAVKPPAGWTLNFMCLSFAFLIAAHMFGGVVLHQ